MIDVISGRLMGPDVPDNRNLVILAIPFLEKLHLNLSEAACSTVFRGNFRPEVVTSYAVWL